MSLRMYVVTVTEDETKNVVKTLGPMPLAKAEKVEAGILRNLNHDRFSVSIDAAS